MNKATQKKGKTAQEKNNPDYYNVESYDASGIVKTLWFFKPFRRWYINWMNRVLPRVKQITLDRNRVFVFPAREGLMFLMCALAVFLGGTNYENNLILGLGFLLFSVFLVTIWHTFFNLLGLTLSAGSALPVFNGEVALFKVTLKRPHTRMLHALNIYWPLSKSVLVDIDKDEASIVELGIVTNKRGRFEPPRLTVDTRFPLGLIRCWTHVALDMSCIVYPKPIENNIYISDGSEGQFGTKINHESNDDFYELKKYQNGDALSHVAWKSYSKGLGMMTKAYAGYLEEAIWLDWDDFDQIDDEKRLSYLAYWVLQCHRSSRVFGLKLPGNNIAPSSGEDHKETCLLALALY